MGFFFVYRDIGENCYSGKALHSLSQKAILAIFATCCFEKSPQDVNFFVNICLGMTDAKFFSI